MGVCLLACKSGLTFHWQIMKVKVRGAMEWLSQDTAQTTARPPNVRSCAFGLMTAAIDKMSGMWCLTTSRLPYMFITLTWVPPKHYWMSDFHLNRFAEEFVTTVTEVCFLGGNISSLLDCLCFANI